MKFLVLNGSPKGSSSITYHTVLYLQKKFPDHSFDVLHVGQKIRSLEKDFSPALAMLAQADVLLFSYPVYTFIAPCQLHRFIELMKEHQADVKGKLATQVTTSKHFYDVTAHRYIQDNAQDMGMHFLRGLSADMEDLTTEGPHRGGKVVRPFPVERGAGLLRACPPLRTRFPCRQRYGAGGAA